MSGPEWTPEPSDDPVNGRPLNDAQGDLISSVPPTVQVGSNPFGPGRASPSEVAALAQDDAEAEAHLIEDENAAASGPSKIAALIGLTRRAIGGVVGTLGVMGATLANFRRRSKAVDDTTDPTDTQSVTDADPDLDSTLIPDPGDVGFASPEPRPGRSWSPAGWAWETRVGVAAVFSFLILVSALVVKKGWLGDLRLLTASIKNGQKADPTDPASDETKAPEPKTEPKAAQVDPVATTPPPADEPPTTDSPPNPTLASNDSLRLRGGPAMTADPAHVPPAPLSNAPVTLATDHPESPGPSSLPTIDASPDAPLSEFAPPTTLGGDGTNPPILPADPVATGEMPSLPTDPLTGPDPAAPPPTATPGDPVALPEMPPTITPSDPPVLLEAPPTVVPIATPPTTAPPVKDKPKPTPAAAPTEPAILPVVEPVAPPPTPTTTPTPTPAPQPLPEPAPQPQPEPAELPPAVVEAPATTPQPAESPSFEQIPASAAAIDGGSEPASATRGDGWVVIPSAGKRPGAGASSDPGTGSRSGNDNLLGSRPKVADGPPIRDDLGASAGQVGLVLHTVQADENFWTISKQYYNSPRYYKALHQANAGQVPDITKLYVGTVIRIPPPETLDRSLVTPPLIGASVDGPVISRASTADNGTDVSADPGTDPDPGMTSSRSSRPGLRNGRPSLSARNEPSTEAPRRPIYRVKPNDTLRSIARDTLRDSHRATEIYNLNRDTLSDIRALPAPGTTLTLPTDAVIGPRLR